MDDERESKIIYSPFHAYEFKDPEKRRQLVEKWAGISGRACSAVFDSDGHLLISFYDLNDKKPKTSN